MENSLLSTKEYGIVSGQTPYATYIKAILGKLYVRILSPYNQEIEGIILEGDPKSRNRESCIIDVWSVNEDRFFKRENSKHFEKGYLIPYTRKEVEPEEEDLINSLSDEELTKLLNSRFLTLQSKVNKMTSVAPLFRMIDLAKELDKSQKIIAFLEGKLAELQMEEYPQIEEE